MDLTFTSGHDRFNVRVAVVVVARGRVLLQGMRGCSWMIPPGGRCAMHEATADAAARELREELGLDVPVGPLLWLVENFFRLDDFTVHELTFVYGVRLPDDHALAQGDGDHRGLEADPDLFYRWVPLADTSRVEVYPEILRTRCDAWPEVTEHLVVRGPASEPARGAHG